MVQVDDQIPNLNFYKVSLTELFLKIQTLQKFSLISVPLENLQENISPAIHMALDECIYVHIHDFLLDIGYREKGQRSHIRQSLLKVVNFHNKLDDACVIYSKLDGRYNCY